MQCREQDIWTTKTFEKSKYIDIPFSYEFYDQELCLCQENVQCTFSRFR